MDGLGAGKDPPLVAAGNDRLTLGCLSFFRSFPLATLVASDVKDMALADAGLRRINWAERDMPVLRAIRERSKKRSR